MLADAEVRQHVYDTIVARGRPPLAAEVATAFATRREDVIEAFSRLFARRLLALAPETLEIVMAPPFSAIPTPFLVTARGHSYFANCVWDGFGIAAALHEDARVDASCACCGEPMTLRIEHGAPASQPGVAHFAVPAAHWWDDIVYT